MNSSDEHLLSLIIPAYKQEKIIVKDLIRIKNVMDQLRYDYEMIVVIDGKLDKTLQNAKKVASTKIKIVSYNTNRGKGYAVQFGMARARGDVIGFIDAGMDLDPHEISIMLDIMDWNNADIMVGSKLHPESKVVNYPFIRKVFSWSYRVLTHILFGFSVRDTQVGLKFYKKKVAKDVFSKIIVKGFAFDVEILAIAYKLGYTKIYESPIKLDFKNVSSSITASNFWRIILRMLWDTFAIYYRLKIIKYYDENQRR